MTRYMHCTAGYALNILREGSPSLKAALLADGANEADAIAELEAMPPSALVSCGRDHCPDCDADTDNKGNRQ